MPIASTYRSHHLAMHLVQVGQPAFRAHDQAGLASRSRMLQRPQLAQIKSQLFSANRRPWPVHDSAYGGGGGPPANSKRLGSFDRGPNRGWLFALGPLYVLSLFCASALYDAGQAYKGPTINWKSKLQSISFIIPTLNEELCISDCVRSLRDGHDPFLEIIVVDGGSTDQTIAKALKAGAKVVKAKKKGRACQMNAGAEAAKGDILLFLHADTSISSHAADSIRDALSDEKTSVSSPCDSSNIHNHASL